MDRDSRWTAPGNGNVIDAEGQLVVAVPRPKGAGASAVRDRRVRFIASAPDHALLLAAICKGSARVEKWDSERCEVCVGGIRHAVHFDEFGCPILTDNCRTALAKSPIKEQGS